MRIEIPIGSDDESGRFFLESYHFGSDTDLDVYVLDFTHSTFTKLRFVHHDDPDLTLAGNVGDVIRGAHGYVPLIIDGSNPVFVEFRPTAGSSGTVVLNGLALTPEPSTAMLMVLGLLGTFGFGRRHRRRGA
jgi:hypothetical protein